MRKFMFFALSITLLCAFTSNTSSVRHPGYILNTGVGGVYVHDPHVGGASAGIQNVTPKIVGCSPTQAIGVYDDGGTLGVNCLDVGGGTTTSVTTTPAAPAANEGTNYNFQLDAGMPVIPSSIDNYFGIPEFGGSYGSIFYNYSTSMKWNFGWALPQTWGTTNVNTLDLATPTTAGAITSNAWSSATLRQRLKSIRYTSAASINASAGVRTATEVLWRGNTAGAGGWLLWARFSPAVTFANTRVFVGVLAGAAFPGAAADPNAVLNSAYIGCNVGDSNFSICSNDASSTATCSTLGASFPCTTNGALYDLWLSAATNASSIEYYVERLDSAATAAGSLTSDLPANTGQMVGVTWINSGSQSSGTAIDWFGIAFIANN